MTSRKGDSKGEMGVMWWQRLKDIDAVYECPYSTDGKRLGPLVGYAGKDAQGRHYVGDMYANLAVLERDTSKLMAVAADMIGEHLPVQRARLFCGAPEGGKAFAFALASSVKASYFYPDQEVVEGTRTKKLTFARHEGVANGKEVFIVEDVMNNFSTTAELINLIEGDGGTVIGIIGILNRSLTVDEEFNGLPVHALIRRPIWQYAQDAKEVVDDVQKGNVVLKPKHEWARLKAAMEAAT